MSGTSALAITQWQIAAQQPPHLACIAPWEGMSDMYRESLYEGGIPMISFTSFATIGACGLNGIDNQAAMALKYPLMNAYWRDKIADFSKITVPAYVCAGWNHFHLRGTINAYRKLGSKDKWLRAHREFEWPDFYSNKRLQELKTFFDRYCKDINNGWELTPRVRLDVMDAYDEDYLTERSEDAFPLKRTQYQKLYLDASSMSLARQPVQAESLCQYDAQTGQAEFDIAFNEGTELTGYIKLHLFVEADGHDDMDLFVTIKKLHANKTEIPVTLFSGTAPHPGSWGKLRVSHRELDPELSTEFQPVQAHTSEQKLAAGQIVEVDIEINPTSRYWHAGEILRLQVAGRYIRDEHWIEPLMWETSNQGQHVIHTGGQHDSYLQVPIIEAKYDRSKPFVVDESKHPSHPIF
jgi:putative CocE/NonD family hydrolase